MDISDDNEHSPRSPVHSYRSADGAPRRDGDGKRGRDKYRDKDRYRDTHRDIQYNDDDDDDNNRQFFNDFNHNNDPNKENEYNYRLNSNYNNDNTGLVLPIVAIKCRKTLDTDIVVLPQSVPFSSSIPTTIDEDVAQSQNPIPFRLHT